MNPNRGTAVDYDLALPDSDGTLTRGQLQRARMRPEDYHPARDPFCYGCGGTGWRGGSPCPCTGHLHGPDGCDDICAPGCPTRLENES